MIIQYIKAEFIKEKRSSNKKLLLISSLIFIGFTYLMSVFMGNSPNGKSYLVTAAFNWYPIIILPIIISLYVSNILKKEKSYNKVFFASMNLNTSKIIFAKNIVILIELFIIIMLAGIATYILANFVIGDAVTFTSIILPTFYLYIGILPIISISFILYKYTNGFVVILINFLFSFLSAVIAVKSYWLLFPWSYNLRMMAPALGIHPNGTFLNPSSNLNNPISIPIGVFLSIFIYLLLLFIQMILERIKYD